MATSGVREIILLTLGWEDLPRAISIEGADPTLRMREPVPGVLLHVDGGWLLLDTGFNTALMRDAAYRRRFYAGPEHISILPGSGEPLHEALDKVGIDIGDITTVALSHLHIDHAGGLRHFAGRAAVHVQRAELDYGLSSHPGPERNAVFRVDFDDPAHLWQLADGDVEIAPGVTAVLTAGHTPGHQSFVVDLDESVGGGGFVFAFDAADLTENIEQEISIGARVDAPPEQSVEAIRRLKSIAEAKGYDLIPGHDPIVWPALTETFAQRWPRPALLVGAG